MPATSRTSPMVSVPMPAGVKQALAAHINHLGMSCQILQNFLHQHHAHWDPSGDISAQASQATTLQILQIHRMTRHWWAGLGDGLWSSRHCRIGIVGWLHYCVNLLLFSRLVFARYINMSFLLISPPTNS